MSDLLGTLAITSHRGGSGRSLLASGLAAWASEQGIRTLLIDLAPGGGAASLGPTGLMPHHDPWRGNSEPRPTALTRTLQALRATPDAITGAGWAQIESRLAGWNTSLVVIDAPTLSRPLQAGVLARCNVVLAAVPADANSLKSILPYLEFLAEEKHRPNRVFQPAAVLTRVQLDSPPMQALFETASTFLGPLLLQGVIPEEETFARAMAQGLMPSARHLSPAAAGAIDNVGRQLLAMLAPAGAAP